MSSSKSTSKVKGSGPKSATANPLYLGSQAMLDKGTLFG